MGQHGQSSIIGTSLYSNPLANSLPKSGILLEDIYKTFKEASVLFSPNQPVHEEKWNVQPPGVFKINVDGATSEGERNSSVGVVIRDSSGAVMAACCKYFQGKFSVLEVESLAIECGILLARDLKLSNVIVESDALSVIQRINSKETEGSLGHLIQSILGLLFSFRSRKFKHLKRDYERVAHELTQFARRAEVSQVWKGISPPVLQHLVQAGCS